ncbi:hypothetical protein PV326_008868 [Microctonus aethiopoides]|nr:hypothetical protein PV326_008868 [Microctonus aethiopoides]
MAWRSSKLLKHFLQFICLMLAWFTAMSRISNYKHHWSDVLCGILIGIIVSLITFICIGDFFKDKHHYRSCTMTTGALSTANNAETAMQVNNGTADHILPQSTDDDDDDGVDADAGGGAVMLEWHRSFFFVFTKDENVPLRNPAYGLNYGGTTITNEDNP